MMTDKKSIYEKIDNIPNRAIHISVWVLTVYLLLNPIGLPIALSGEVIGFYDALESLPDGSEVLVAVGSDLSYWPDNYPSCIALVKHLFNTGLKPIFWSASVGSPLLIMKTIETVNPEQSFGAVYGEDYAVFGFLPGGEAAFITIAEDFRRGYQTDYFGANIDDLPIMNGINAGKDVSPIAVIWSNTGGQVNMITRQFAQPYGTKIIGLIAAPIIGEVLPYYPNMWLGFLAAGGKSAAEYEILTGFLGDGAVFTDTMTALTLYMFVILIATNIAGYGLKRQKEATLNVRGN